MKRVIATTVAAVGLTLSLSACDPAITACSDSKPSSAVSLRGAAISQGYAICDGVTANFHYFWHIRLADGARTYFKAVPR